VSSWVQAPRMLFISPRTKRQSMLWVETREAAMSTILWLQVRKESHRAQYAANSFQRPAVLRRPLPATPL
jgi:hypothetical protein